MKPAQTIKEKVPNKTKPTSAKTPPATRKDAQSKEKTSAKGKEKPPLSGKKNKTPVTESKKPTQGGREKTNISERSKASAVSREQPRSATKKEVTKTENAVTPTTNTSNTSTPKESLASMSNTEKIPLLTDESSPQVSKKTRPPSVDKSAKEKPLIAQKTSSPQKLDSESRPSSNIKAKTSPVSSETVGSAKREKTDNQSSGSPLNDNDKSASIPIEPILQAKKENEVDKDRSDAGKPSSASKDVIDQANRSKVSSADGRKSSSSGGRKSTPSPVPLIPPTPPGTVTVDEGPLLNLASSSARSLQSGGKGEDDGEYITLPALDETPAEHEEEQKLANGTVTMVDETKNVGKKPRNDSAMNVNEEKKTASQKLKAALENNKTNAVKIPSNTTELPNALNGTQLNAGNTGSSAPSDGTSVKQLDRVKSAGGRSVGKKRWGQISTKELLPGQVSRGNSSISLKEIQANGEAGGKRPLLKSSVTRDSLLPESSGRDSPAKASIFSRKDSARFSLASRVSHVDLAKLQTAGVVLPPGTEDDTDKKPVNYANDTYIRQAIPYLPRWFAVICLILNILLPGTGELHI